jgi:hypothetical protein
MMAATIKTPNGDDPASIETATEIDSPTRVKNRSNQIGLRRRTAIRLPFLVPSGGVPLILVSSRTL